MEKVVLVLALSLSALGMSQKNYEQGMQQALQLWGEGYPTEASSLFERISSAEKENWLPGYYIALINTTEAFKNLDKDISESHLLKAQAALDLLMEKHQNNAELLVMQAMIHTAYIAKDPMTNGQRLTGPVMQLYGQAQAVAPKNPRVVMSKAQFEMGSAQFFGADTTPICAEIEKSLELFDTFKPETPFHPNWGKEQAEQALKSCK